MEKGILPITEEILENIASITNYPLSFFYKQDVKRPISSFYYRKRVVAGPKKNLFQLEAKMDIIRGAIDELLKSVDLPEFNLPNIDLSLRSDTSTNFKEKAEEAARKTRDFLKIPSGPIDRMIYHLEKHGIIIFQITPDIEKFDGITLVLDSGQPIIFINKNIPNDRKRFTIAHELGHLVMHIGRFESLNLDLDRDEEMETNSFASEFCMPAFESIKDLLDLNFEELGTLKSYWKLSKAAILLKAKQIEAISPEKYKFMIIRLSQRGERKTELGTVPLDEPTLINRLIDLHLGDLGYTKSELAEILGLTVSDFDLYFSKSNDGKLRIVI